MFRYNQNIIEPSIEIILQSKITVSLKGNSYQVEKNDVLSEALFMTDITSHDDAIRSNGVLQRF